ncbi:hypothetical protein B7494_g5914 [Chlorociboria aeruginascens]|nr:hypothetical protein B7494_g5914 [Chlorociboria aeruginascens]
MIFNRFFSLSFAFELAVAGVLPDPINSLALSKRDCTNSPSDRACWTPDGSYSIDTDSETSWPTTNRIVPYTLTLTSETAAPDGTPKQMFLVNGVYPGPTLYANWGDTFQITVVNNLTTVSNGTSMHWHGISQINTNTMDGVNGVTECPLPPGQSRVYTFQATQHGTSWYHSHHAVQYADGVLGPIVINGPATANYDVDLGPLPITDLYYLSAYDGALLASTAPPIANNGLINGTMPNLTGTGGHYFNTTLTPGLRYRVRIINTSADNAFQVSLDNHTLEIIAADFVPMTPYNTSTLLVGIGQRYDVIITASEKPSNYWFRAQLPTGGACGMNSNSNINAIFNYDTVPLAIPTTTGAIATSDCSDETNLVPWTPKNVPESAFVYPAVDSLVVGGPENATLAPFVWNFNSTSMAINWETPTLEYINNGTTNWPSTYQVIELPDANAWTFWIINNVQAGLTVPHPIHLHGHDFYLLGSGDGAFTNTAELNFTNPTRRDVAMLPGGGYLVIGFLTDNPGAWLLHCHIAWHVAEGLSIQFLERAADIPSTMDLSGIQPACDLWDAFYATSPNQQNDSGI